MSLMIARSIKVSGQWIVDRERRQSHSSLTPNHSSGSFRRLDEADFPAPAGVRDDFFESGGKLALGALLALDSDFHAAFAFVGQRVLLRGTG